MPRQRRQDEREIPQHVIAHGVDREEIFRDDDDRRVFLARLIRIFRESDITCDAFALLSTHYHLAVVRHGPVMIGDAMQRLNLLTAQRGNRRGERRGHLFQNRYKNWLIEDESYYLQLVRYVHLNPIRAGIVLNLEALKTYPWTSLPAHLGLVRAPYLEVERVLRTFGPDVDSARRNLLEYLAAGLDAPDETPWMIDESARPVLAGWDPEDILEEACRVLEVRLDDLLRGVRSRGVSRARALVSYLTCRLLGVTQDRVAQLLGMSQGGVSTALGRGETLAEQLLDRLSEGIQLAIRADRSRGRRRRRK